MGEYCTVLKCYVATGQLYSTNKFEASRSLIRVQAFPDVNFVKLLLSIFWSSDFPDPTFCFFCLPCVNYSLKISSIKKCYDFNMIVTEDLWQHRQQAADNEKWSISNY